MMASRLTVTFPGGSASDYFGDAREAFAMRDALLSGEAAEDGPRAGWVYLDGVDVRVSAITSITIT